MKKKLIQKLNYLRDNIRDSKKEELRKDIQDLKFSEDDKLELTLAKKYNEN
jgi:hypothetical protein